VVPQILVAAVGAILGAADTKGLPQLRVFGSDTTAYALSRGTDQDAEETRVIIWWIGRGTGPTQPGNQLAPFSGIAAAAACSQGRLFVFFESDESNGASSVYSFFRDPRTGEESRSREARWPNSRRVLAAGGGSRDDQEEIWAILTGPPEAAESSETSSSDSRDESFVNAETLWLSSFSKSRWHDHGILPDSLQDRKEFFVCEAAAEVFVASRVGGLESAIEIWTLADGEWTKGSNVAPRSGGKVLALTPVNRRPFLILAEPVGDTNGEPLSTVRVVPADGMPGGADSPLRLADGLELVAPADSLAAGSCKDRVVIGYISEDGRPFLGAWRETGAMVTAPAPAIEPELDPGVRLVIQILAPLILIGFMLLVFLSKQDRISQPIELPEGVRLAPYGRRSLAMLADLAPALLIAVIIWREKLERLEGYFPAGGTQEPGMQTWMLYAQAFVLGFYACYACVCELVFQSTPGKLALRLRVVSVDGGPLRPKQIIIRNASRMVELCTYCLALLVFVVLTRNRQRVGDLLADTMVVYMEGVDEGIATEVGPDESPMDEDER
jgi:uncharacterized RDD family membrane protein YckC